MKKSCLFFVSLAIIVGLVVPIMAYYKLDYYYVSTESMLPTIKPGSYIIVKGFRWKGNMSFDSSLLKNKIIVLKRPQYSPSGITNSSEGNDVFVKRCYALPGDTVRISRKDLRHKVFQLRGEFNKNIFPHDNSFSWSITQFGPLWVPRKGVEIPLNERNITLYHSLIDYEGNVLKIFNGKYILNGQNANSYTFKNNYYFFLGDNFYSSEDSRFWGFVPENNLIAKVIQVI